MTSSKVAARITLAQRLRNLFKSRTKATQLLFEEILYLSNQVRSLDDLLKLMPERIVSALDLSSFHILLREKSSYVLQNPSSPDAAVTLPSSCSTVSRMRRDRRPALFVPPGSKSAQSDGWQLLAEPYEIEVLQKLHAQVLLPLEGRTGLFGFATLGRTAGRTFSGAELRFLRTLGPEMGRGLETAQLIQSISQHAVEQARARRELELAREVQERLLPTDLPCIPGLDVAASYISAEQIGGDYYDIFLAPDGRACIVVADVSGKGVPAALLMATLRACLHTLMQGPPQPLTSVVESLNRLLFQSSSANRYATMVICLYDPAAHRLTYVNAGHNPPILLRADGSMHQLDTGGSVIGMLSQGSYVSETLTIACGEVLAAYTDGVTEAVNPAGEEWDTPRLEAALAEAASDTSRDAGSLVTNILKSMNDFVAGAPQNDDITLIVLKPLQ